MPKQQDSERLQKYLAGIGIGSRRKIEELIRQGKITVDGKIAQIGDKVIVGSRINVDGRPVRIDKTEDIKFRKQRVILYNKPEGEICTRSDPKGRPTVFRNLPHLKGERWVAVGRLDINTRGLLLFTNDGNLANHLMHPSLEIERDYLCRVFGEVDKEAIKKLTDGIEIDGKKVRFHKVRRSQGEGKNIWFQVTVMEGRYREVRRLWESVGCQLSRLNRISYGKVTLPRGIKLGGWVELEPAMIERLAQNKATEKPLPPKVQRRRQQRQKQQQSRKR